MIEAYKYDSLGAFIKVLDENPILASNLQSQNRFKNGDLGYLAGLTQGEGWPEVRKLWQEGWPEGVARMRELLGTMEPPLVKSRKRKAKWSDEGDEYSKDRVEEGYFDSAWRVVKRQSRRGPTPIRLTVDIEAHINVSHGDLFYRGAGVVLLADALSTAGYPISVVATSGADGMGMNGGKYRQYITVTVKDWTTPTYLPTLISTTGHGAFLRVGVFAHNVHFMPGAHTGGMGYSLETHSSKSLAELGFCEANIKTIPMPQSVGTVESAKDWVRKVVAELEEDM